MRSDEAERHGRLLWELRFGDGLPPLVRGVADEDLISLDAPEARLLSSAAEPLDEVIGRAKAVRSFLASLRPRERRILECRYGLAFDRLTLDELGAEFGVHRERIRQIERHARGRATGPKWAGLLRQYIESDYDPDRPLTHAEVVAAIDNIKEHVAAVRQRREDREAAEAARLAAEEARRVAWTAAYADRVKAAAAALAAGRAEVAEWMSRPTPETPPRGERPWVSPFEQPRRFWATDTDHPGVTGWGATEAAAIADLQEMLRRQGQKAAEAACGGQPPPDHPAPSAAAGVAGDEDIAGTPGYLASFW